MRASHRRRRACRSRPPSARLSRRRRPSSFDCCAAGLAASATGRACGRALARAVDRRSAGRCWRSAASCGCLFAARGRRLDALAALRGRVARRGELAFWSIEHACRLSDRLAGESRPGARRSSSCRAVAGSIAIGAVLVSAARDRAGGGLALEAVGVGGGSRARCGVLALARAPPEPPAVDSRPQWPRFFLPSAISGA